MITECPACGKSSAPLEGPLRIGYGAKCGAWLGMSSATASLENCVSLGGFQPEFISSQLLGALKLIDPVEQSTIAARIETLVRNPRLVERVIVCALSKFTAIGLFRY